MNSNKKNVNFSLFVKPTAEYRPSLFYSLNDSLKPDIIKKELKDISSGGTGGVFLHAREGLLTQYFGDDWWNAIDAAVEQCKESGIEPWFYDEYKWPSGFGSGVIPRQNSEYRNKYLARLKMDGVIPVNGELVSEDSGYKYVCMTAEMDNLWLNGTCKIDYFNPEAVAAFINYSYKPYAHRNSQKYDNRVKGIFYDEPDIIPASKSNYDGIISYSPFVRESFKKETGYDIASKFNCLFEEDEGFRKVRLDYFQVISKQYEESFSKQIGDFSRQHNLIQTGHYFPEESLGSVMSGIGNLMRHVRHEGEPGMDHLELRVAGGLNVAKSISSVANQYGRVRRMSEVFGASGQNMSFEDRKWIANWNIVLGINHLVEHLALYSMSGVRKRDFPPVLSQQQPWWKYNKFIEDYFGRLCYMSTLGRYAATILVIHPQESAYIATANELDALEKNYYSILENLLVLHRDYDLGDEQIIAEIGTVSSRGLEIGAMTYKQVVIPSTLTLRETTVNLLLKFASMGGKIFIAGDFPAWINAETSDLLKELKDVSIILNEDRLNKLNDNLAKPYTIEGENSADIYTQLRTVEGGDMLMLTNISRLKTAEITLTYESELATPILWNPETGECSALKKSTDNKFHLQVYEGGFMIITRGTLSKDVPTVGNYSTSHSREKIASIEGNWKAKRLDPNAIVLDFARYSTNNGKSFSNPEPVIGIANRFEIQHYTGPLILNYELEVADIPVKCNLVVENPGNYKKITLNGQSIGFSPKNYYRDYFFLSSNEISEFLKKGKNIIELSLNFIPPAPSDDILSKRYGTEIESIYLTGEFAVNANKTLISWDTEKNNTNLFVMKPVYILNGFDVGIEKDSVNSNLTISGYPFYAGSFQLEHRISIPVLTSGKRYYLVFPTIDAIVLEMSINGNPLPPLYSSPYVTEVSAFLKTGDNIIRIKLTNSLRNLLGPHHHAGGELKGVSPLSFTGSGGWPQGPGDKDWYDLRRSNNPLRIWRDDYYCIPFGLPEAPFIETEPRENPD